LNPPYGGFLSAWGVNMSESRQSSFHRDVSNAKNFAPTSAEINFLWSFIQGSITVPETWNALVRSYGFCERHAWIHISVEMSFRGEYLLGSTILYAELIEKALRAVSRPQSMVHNSLEQALRSGGPCFLCSMNLRNGASAGAAPRSRLDPGSDNSVLRTFAGLTERVWRSWLCPECAGRECAGATPTSCGAMLSPRHAPTGRSIFQPKDTCCMLYSIMSGVIKTRFWSVVPRRPIKIGRL
jgi:hypothetical protein